MARYRFARLVAKPFGLLSAQAAEHVWSFWKECHVALVHKAGVRKARRLRHAGDLALNVGSGSQLKEGFLNVDFCADADIRLDLRQRLPFADESCALVFCEHFLEHLEYPEEASLFVGECFRVLRPAGALSLSVPDTEWPLREYATGETAYLEACDEHRWHPRGCTTLMEHINYHFRQRWTGSSDDDFDCHRFAYDFETMTKLLERHGFADVRERGFEAGLDSEHRRVGSLFLAATKPATRAGPSDSMEARPPDALYPSER